MKISVVINVDTRPENNTNQKMFSGVVDRDFLFEGVKNKIKLFNGFDKEIIVFVDEHEIMYDHEVDELRSVSDTLIIRKHNKSFEDIEDFPAFNDWNYLTALFAARGKYVFHFDGDVAAFAPNKDAINEQIELLEKYDFVSYPSHWSPYPVYDDSFEGNFWVSTRYFCCKRSSLDFSEIIKCQLDYDYWKDTYPRSRLCHWTEHILQSIAKKGIYYPPIDYDKFILFTWESYRKGLLSELNNMPYEEVKNFVVSKGGIFYPNNLNA
jgi:hypothetical protein